MITVNTLPTISAISSPAQSCAGAPVNLSASGNATNYQWQANTAFLQGNSVIVNPMVPTTYSVIGTDENGCSTTITIVQQVQICTGIDQMSNSITGLNVYPNPTNSEFNVELNNGLNKTIEVMDLTGRVLSVQSSLDNKITVSISTLANGVYYVKVKSDNATEVLKIVKQ